MIDLELIHVVDIDRRAESIVEQELVHDANVSVGTNRPCLIQPLSQAVNPTSMGVGQQETFGATFLAGEDLAMNDLVAWTDPTDGLEKVLVVRGIERPRDNMFGGGLESHVNATLHRRIVDGT